MTESDRTLGPFTWGPWHKCFSIEWSSGGGEEQDPRNFLRVTAFGWALRMWLPRILRPWVEVRPSYADPTHVFTIPWPREYGIFLSNGGCERFDFLRIYYGAQTHDSRTTKCWSKFLPWMQWDHVRHSLYAPDGEHLYTEPSRKEARKLKGFDHNIWNIRETAPAAYFAFEDYDGKKLIATCHIEEREWHRGTGWFRWLKYFFQPKISRSLNLEFDHEMGPEKGSWKGGTTGHSCEMRPGEYPINAFKRYCDMEHRARGNRTYKIRFIGPCGPPEPRDIRVARNRGWQDRPDGRWYNVSINITGNFSTEEMLTYIRKENNANNAEIAGKLKS